MSNTTRVAWIIFATTRFDKSRALAHARTRALTRVAASLFAREHDAAERIARALVPRARRRHYARVLARALSAHDPYDVVWGGLASFAENAAEAHRFVAPSLVCGDLYTPPTRTRRLRMRGRTRASQHAWVDATYVLPLGPTLKILARPGVAALVR